MPTIVESIYHPDHYLRYELPLFMVPVEAGFPSPAEDYIEGKLDLNEHLVKHPAATFFVKVTGDSMLDAGIHPGDILIVDRSLEASDKKVVIAIINGELTVKRIRKTQKDIVLMPENKKYNPIKIDNEMSFDIWGVVTSVIHRL